MALAVEEKSSIQTLIASRLQIRNIRFRIYHLNIPLTITPIPPHSHHSTLPTHTPTHLNPTQTQINPHSSSRKTHHTHHTAIPIALHPSPPPKPTTNHHYNLRPTCLDALAVDLLFRIPQPFLMNHLLLSSVTQTQPISKSVPSFPPLA